MKDIAVSMIVTVHNSAKFLRQCLDSVCGQTLSNLEILCMDGGSTDSSPDILQEYAGRDDRIRIINDANTSYGHKINKGIEEARGKYIGILETDDCMKPDMLQSLYETAEREAVDFADGDYDFVFLVEGQKCRSYSEKYGSGDYYDRILSLGESRSVLRTGPLGAIWTGIYRADFLRTKGIRMFESPGASYQDTSFRFLVCALADTSYHMRRAVYEYQLDNPDSSMRDENKIFAIAEEYKYLKYELEQRRLHDKKIWAYYYSWKYSSYYWNTYRLKDKAREKFLVHYKMELLSDIEKGHIVENGENMPYPGHTFLLLRNSGAFEEKLKESVRRGAWGYGNIYRQLETVIRKKIIIFGAGKRGNRALNFFLYSGIKVECFCDNSDKQQTVQKNGYEVLPVNVAVQRYPLDAYVIAIFDNQKYEEMKQQLESLRIPLENISRYEL